MVCGHKVGQVGLDRISLRSKTGKHLGLCRLERASIISKLYFNRCGKKTSLSKLTNKEKTWKKLPNKHSYLSIILCFECRCKYKTSNFIDVIIKKGINRSDVFFLLSGLIWLNVSRSGWGCTHVEQAIMILSYYTYNCCCRYWYYYYYFTIWSD